MCVPSKYTPNNNTACRCLVRRKLSVPALTRLEKFFFYSVLRNSNSASCEYIRSEIGNVTPLPVSMSSCLLHRGRFRRETFWHGFDLLYIILSVKPKIGTIFALGPVRQQPDQVWFLASIHQFSIRMAPFHPERPVSKETNGASVAPFLSLSIGSN